MTVNSVLLSNFWIKGELQKASFHILLQKLYETTKSY